MAEHERTKPELPTGPPRPHPQGLMRTLSLAAVAVTAAALALTACDPYPQGPAGTVAGRSSEFHSSTKTRWYFLTTSSKFRVDFATYKACSLGSAWPHCREVR